jgi:polyisoprenoid-binding protein YceI
MTVAEESSQQGVREWHGMVMPTPGEFVVDPAHTRVGFIARHLMVTKVRGHFADVAGTITVAEDPLQSSAQAVMQAGSITTGSADRDAHLRSADFLKIDEYPTVGYRSTGISASSGGTFAVRGELTIRGVTREVPLEVEIDGMAADPWGGQRLSLTARGEIDREDFGLTWNVALESGGVLVSKKVVLEIEAQAVRQT